MFYNKKKIKFIENLKTKRLKLYVAESITGGKFTSELVKFLELTGSSPLLPVVGPVEGEEERCIPPPGCHRSGVMLAAAI